VPPRRPGDQLDSAQPAGITLEGRSIDERGLKPPLVSLILINRNYAAYLGETIDSIRRQDYPWLECFVVDNASTDGSEAVIARHVADDSRFTVVPLQENLGQLRAALQIFDRLRGSFVAFVDADDILFPNYLSVHVQAHLALPAAVAFTSSNIIETDADKNVLTGGRLGFAANCESELRGLKPAAATLRLASISDSEYERLSETTITIPHWRTQWVWAPGTANVYRKSALDLVRPDASRILGHASCDGYFCTILHLMSGSVLICRHLSVYRFHGRNTFGSSPLMKAVRTNRSFAAKQEDTQRLHVLRTFLLRADEFNWILAGNRFWSTIDLLATIGGGTPDVYFARNDVQDVIAESLPPLIKTFGAGAVLMALRERMNARALRRLIGQAHAGEAAHPLRWKLAKVEARRAWRWPIRRRRKS